MEFYANIESKKNLVIQTVTCYVKDHRIHLTQPILAFILGVSDEGPNFIMVKDSVQSDS